MSSGTDRLAAYLDQRRRLGEPGVVPAQFEPGELMAFLRSRLAAASSAATSPEPALQRPTPPLARGVSSPAGTTALPTSRGLNRTPAPGGSSPAPAFDGPASRDYETLRETALSCTRCRLAEGRRHVVFSDGNPAARLMVVGEAPGAREDATGLPFVGQAGKLLDLMLASVSLSRRDSVYICNVLKCRPPGNRNPMPDEIEACARLLKGQIELVAPEVLLAVGSFAAQSLTGTTGPLGKLRGKLYSYRGVPLIVTYHPAALLRNPGWNRFCWDDLQLLRQVLDQT